MNARTKFHAPIAGAKGKGGGSAGARAAVEDNNTLRSTQIAEVVDIISEGEIVGLENGAKDIFLDDTPLLQSDGITSNFEDVTWEEKLGTQAQTRLLTALGGGSSSSVAVNTEVKVDTPVTNTVTNGDVDFVLITIRIPALTSQDRDTGDLHGSSVTFGLEYKENGGVWTSHQSPTISGKNTSSYSKTYKMPLPAGGAPWDIRVTRVSPDDAVTTEQSRTFWDSYVEHVEEKLSYPNSALVRLEIDAQQFSAIPKRTFLIKGMKVQIPSNYTVATRAYSDPWDGSFVTAWCDNPAWIFYDLATNPRYGLGAFVAAADVDKFGLYTIAKYCDALVDDGAGGTEPRFTCNMVIKRSKDAWVMLQHLASVFRGMPYWGASQISAVQDSPVSAIYQFTNANVIGGVFTYQGTPRSARHTAALVEWIDPEDNYNPAVEFVSGATADITRYGYRQTTIQAHGCTSRGQAHRLGKWALITNANETEVVEFKTGYEGVVVSPGSIINIMDTHRAGKQWGGRVNTVSTAASVTLDRSVTIEAGKTYTLTLIQPDTTIESQTVTEGAGSYTVLTPSSSYANAPIANSVWVLTANDLAATQWRVLSVRESKKNQFAVEAVKHVSTKYASVESDVILETRPTSSIISELAAPINFLPQSRVVNQQGEMKIILYASWESVSTAVKWIFRYQLFNGVWQTSGFITTPYFEAFIEPGDYNVEVVAYSQNGIASPRTVDTLSVTGVEGVQVMPKVSGLELFEQGNDKEFVGKDAKFAWRAAGISEFRDIGNEDNGADAGSMDPVFQDYKINMRDPNNGDALLREEFVVDPYYTYTFEKNVEDGGPFREFTIEVWQRGTLGQLSDTPAILTVDNPAPAAPTGLAVEGITKAIAVTMNAFSETDWDGIVVYGSTSSGFTPGPGNLLWDTSTDFAVVTGLISDTEYFIVVAGYDSFGKDVSTLNLSSELAATTFLITETEIADDSISTPKLKANVVTAAKIFGETITAAEISGNTITADKYNQLRNSMVFTFNDSLDPAFPYIFTFEIIDESTTIQAIKLTYEVLNFRAYVSSATAQGSALVTSASGGGETPTSSSGGGQTSSSTSIAHSHTITWQHNTTFGTGVLHWKSGVNGSEPYIYAAGGGSSQTKTSDSGGGSHTHTVANHTHTVTIAAHTHDVTVPAHNHLPIYGIYEVAHPAFTVNVYADNGSGYGSSIYSSSADEALDIDIKSNFSGTGIKRLKFTCGAAIRIQGMVITKLDISA